MLGYIPYFQLFVELSVLLIVAKKVQGELLCLIISIRLNL
jgi:hypothetical protein